MRLPPTSDAGTAGSIAGSGGGAGTAPLGGFGGTIVQGGQSTGGAGGPGCAGGCPNGPLGVHGKVEGSGFESDEGKLVHAAIRGSWGAADVSTPVAMGKFALSWDTYSSSICGGCNLGGPLFAISALVYVDRNGNGTCEAASDLVFVRGGTNGLDLEPISANDEVCDASTSDSALARAVEGCAGLAASCPGGGAAGAGSGGESAGGAGGAP